MVLRCRRPERAEEEVERGEVTPHTFTLRNMANRIKDAGDLWAGMAKRKRSLTRPVSKLKSLAKEAGLRT